MIKRRFSISVFSERGRGCKSLNTEDRVAYEPIFKAQNLKIEQYVRYQRQSGAVMPNLGGTAKHFRPIS